MLLLGYKCFTLKYKALKKTQNTPKNQNAQHHITEGKMGSDTVRLQQSGSAVVLPHPQILCIIQSLVDEPLAGLLPSAGSTPHISVLHPIDLPTLFPLPSRLPQAKCYSRR